VRWPRSASLHEKKRGRRKKKKKREEKGKGQCADKVRERAGGTKKARAHSGSRALLQNLNFHMGIHGFLNLEPYLRILSMQNTQGRPRVHLGGLTVVWGSGIERYSTD